MDSTFMTIHNLSSDANILFASDSIFDILGYQPRDVEGRSCFDYFHPEEVPLARYVHGRGVLMDKAAALHYTRIRNVHGQWVGCECTFSVVHDILVACTSIYHGDEKSERRAHETPQVRRMFSSPQDPRYHMLGHLARKFTMAPPDRELRAALIINRFTRSLAIMFATNSVAEILGLDPSELQGKSFYECIDDNCLDDAIECIEAAKANDSIAYLRFHSRDARREEDLAEDSSDTDNDLSGDTLGDGSSGEGEGRSGSASVNRDSASRRDSTDSEPGGVRLDAATAMDLDAPSQSASPIKREPMSQEPEGVKIASNSSGSGGESSNQQSAAQSSGSDGESSQSRENGRNGRSSLHEQRRQYPVPSVEIEAFISCTSDGLVVVLRRARQLPSSDPGSSAAGLRRQGTFAAPWATQPVAAHYGPSPAREPDMSHASQQGPQHVSVPEGVRASGGPPVDELMASIQEVAVFAWALVGINRNLSSYSHGSPMGNAQPPEDQFYKDKSAGTQLSAFVASDQGTQAQQQPSVSHAVSEKGQPIEPPYTPYSEQGANQLRNNGPWSNGGGGQALHSGSQGQTSNGQHALFNGNGPVLGQSAVFNNSATWGQDGRGHHSVNGNGHQSTH